MFVFDKNTCTEKLRRSFSGTAQGSVLSPLTFNVYVNNIFDNLTANALAYADDIVIYSSNKSLDIASKDVQEALNQICCNLNKIDLALSPEKSKAIIFCNKN